MERIEVITSVQRRRRYSGQEKAQFVALAAYSYSNGHRVAHYTGHRFFFYLDSNFEY